MEVVPNVVGAIAVGDDDLPVGEAVPEFNPMDSTKKTSSMQCPA